MILTSEDELLIRFAQDKRLTSESNCMLTNTRFLDFRQQSLLSEHFLRSKTGSRLFFFGGFSGSERAVGIFVPELFDIDSTDKLVEILCDNPDSCPVNALRVVKDRFSVAPGHRDYLGALMGLGVKREFVGDIIVADDGCDIVVIKSVCSYIRDNLTAVGRAKVETKSVDLGCIRAGEQKTELLTVSVASMRLDAVIAAVFRLSRSQASELIAGGLVFVNGIERTKPDYFLSPCDKLVLRGRGKIKLLKELGVSKKGKIRLEAEKYI